MVAATATISFPEDSNSRLPLSQEDLRTRFRQAEAELYRSKSYRRVLADLQQIPTSDTDVQALLKVLCKEAIRLTLRQVVRSPQPNLSPLDSVSEEASSEAPLTLPSFQNQPELAQNSSQVGRHGSATLTLVPSPATSPTSEKGKGRRFWKPTHSSSKGDNSNPTLETYQAQLHWIGQQLQQVRLAQSLSLEELYQKTWVPLHQIKSLEAGCVDELPEDVYVRGFIRRIGNALGVNGAEIAATLPVPESAKTPVPSWHHRSPEAQPTLQPSHLYIGYAALMAGAMGGLTWISQHPIDPSTVIDVDLSRFNPFQENLSQSEDGFQVIPGTSSPGSIATPDVALPEHSPLN